jgi:hypothetical protein
MQVIDKAFTYYSLNFRIWHTSRWEALKKLGKPGFNEYQIFSPEKLKILIASEVSQAKETLFDMS